jgi:DNA-binding beta-propeller fold protein YncE
MRYAESAPLAVLSAVLISILSACGGGGESIVPPPPPQGSFEIKVNPSSIVTAPGDNASITLQAKIFNGFSGPISVTINGLPSGVTASPSSPFTLAGTAQTIALKASSTAQQGSSALTFEGTSGTLSAMTKLSLLVPPPQPGTPNNRSDFVRTDDTPLAIVYDPKHDLVFASALHLNCVSVISVATASLTKCIPVSGPLGLSLSADNSQVLVGTQTGEVAWIDTGSLQVVRRDAIPKIPATLESPEGNNYVRAAQAFQAANGKVLLVTDWGYLDLHGNLKPSSLVEWDPVAGTSAPKLENSGGLVAVSANHSKILIGGEGPARIYDSATDSFALIPGYSVRSLPAINSTGNQFALVGGSPSVTFFDGQIRQVGSVDVCCGPVGAVYSPDGNHLYVVVGYSGLPLVYTIDARTFKIIGAAPAYSRLPGSPSIVAHPQAADSTGLVFGIADHGVAIDDSTTFRNFGNNVAPGYLAGATPDHGAINAQTITNLSTTPFDSIPDLFFGQMRAQNVSLDSRSEIQATAPPSANVGPVNIKAMKPNGVILMMPQAFTYGALITNHGRIAADPKGNNLQADLYGYGLFDPGIDTKVMIGPNAATVLRATKYSSEAPPYPFPLDHLQITLPNGSPGPQGLSVSSSAGTASKSGWFHYLTDVTTFTSPDAFSYLLYDSRRENLYLSAGSHVDVFSAASRKYLTPITVPTIHGSTQLQGLALTPDGSKLLVANFSDSSVAAIDPDNPTTASSVVSIPTGTYTARGPFQIATTATNKAFITMSEASPGSGEAGGIYQIDLGTMQVVPAALPYGYPSGYGIYLQGSQDGKVVMAALPGSAGPVLKWQAATDVWSFRYVQVQTWDDIAVAGDGNGIALSGYPASYFPLPYFMDTSLNITSQVNFSEFESFGNGPGIQFDSSGALLYEPTVTGVDLIDARSGQLRERIIIGEQLNYGSKLMALTPSGDQVFLATSAGLTILQLDSVPLGVGSVTPTAASPGTVITVRGTGFRPDTTANLGGNSAVVSLVDTSTLKISVPSGLRPGPTQLILQNPDGDAYSLEGGFTVQ